MIGQSLLHYRVTEKIGEGGMGIVYRATDTKLGRDVAIKVLPEALSDDKERLARFDREARVLASLNHPNLAAIHGLEESNHVSFLVLELVPGETLAERISRGPLPIEEALPLFHQIAEGIDAAHSQGVIHRDLKPANIKITPDGKVKVLDFGLAKPFEAEPTQDLSHSPTLTRNTEAGVILGTASYMSPEQARGHVVDKRTDIWAFGCVLYEALTGRVAFPGETLSDILANVLKQEPEWERLPDETPAWVHALLRRCLRKDPERRLRDIGDARLEIEDAPSGGAESFVPAKTATKPQRFLPWIVAGLVTAVVLWVVGPGGNDPQVVRTSIVLPPEEDPARFDIDISPDGANVVYSATYDDVRKVYLRSLHEGEPTPIPGTEGGRLPFFSPDGEWVGFFANDSLKKVRLDGLGAVTLSASATSRGGSWGPSSNIVFPLTRDSGLMEISADGGDPNALTTLDLDQHEQYHLWPHVLPNGAVLFNVHSGGSADDASIVAVSPSTGERRFVAQGAYPRYVSTGHLIYGRGGTLYAVPFDLDRLEVRGTGVPVQVGVAANGMAGNHIFAISETGTLIFQPARVTDRRMVLVDLEGRIEPLAAPSLAYFYAQFSPDGGELVSITDDGEVHLYELEHQRFSLLFSSLEDGAGKVWTPFDLNWSPDGTQFAVIASSPGTGLGYEMFITQVGDSATVTPLASSPAHQWAPVWSPDGKRLLYIQQEIGEFPIHIWELPLEPAGDPRVILTAGVHPTLSPDGRWLTYSSWQPGGVESQIYVREYDGIGRGRQISTDGGRASIWAPDGRTIYYRNGEKMMAVELSLDATFSAGTPRVLFEDDVDLSRYFDLSPDGRKFVMIQDAPEPSVTQIRVVLNWTEELKRLVPIE